MVDNIFIFILFFLFFFFKRKTEYELRISDWSSDVCSSDLVYAPTAADARAVASALRERFAATDGIVDIDTSMEADAPREIVVVDRARAAHLGISQASIAQTLQLALSGFDASYLRDGASKYAVPLRLRLPAGDQASMDALLALRVQLGRAACRDRVCQSV